MKPFLSVFAAGSLIGGLQSIQASNSFEEASKHLDLDGSVIGYVDFDGDGQSIGSMLNAVYAELLSAETNLPPIPLDFPAMIETLGFGSLRSFAMSSKEIEPGLHRNRTVSLMDGEPAGMMALYGLEPTDFRAAAVAPMDATSAFSGRFDLTAVRDTLVALLAQVMGPMGQGMADGYLAQPIPGTDISANEAIEALSSDLDFYFVQKMASDMQMDIKGWLSIAGAGSLLERLRPLMAEMPVEFLDTDGGLRADFSAMLQDAPFGLYLQASSSTGALLIYTDEAMAEAPEATLADAPGFQQLIKRLPPGAAMYSYNAGFDLEPLLSALTQQPEMAAYAPAARKAVESFLGGLVGPNVSAVYKVDGALLTEQYAGYSFKEIVAVVPVALGAAMAVPALAQVKNKAQDAQIENNLRIIYSAAQERMMEDGSTEVSFTQLQDESSAVAEIEPVAGESYEDIWIEEGSSEIGVYLPDGRYVYIDLGE